jgi:hypothetical protein
MTRCRSSSILPTGSVSVGQTPADPASLLHPSEAATLRTQLVDRRVACPKNNGPELLKPIDLA